MKDLDALKKRYEEIPIPDDLDEFVDQIVTQETMQKTSKHRGVLWFSKRLVPACFLLFLCLLNTSETFAHAMFEVPLLSDVSHFLCMREYKDVSLYNSLDIQMPQLQNTGNTDLEKRINNEIAKKMQEIVKETKEEAKDWEEIIQQENIPKEEIHPIEVLVDYQIYYQSDTILSFVITKTTQRANAMQEFYMYNLDIKQGHEITLETLFGPSYKEIIDQEIQKQITARLEEDENNFYFDGSNGIAGFTTINDKQKFYMNADGNVVIVFEKYEIAPGYMGAQEFVIPVKEYMKG